MTLVFSLLYENLRQEYKEVVFAVNPGSSSYTLPLSLHCLLYQWAYLKSRTQNNKRGHSTGIFPAVDQRSVSSSISM